jgi:hypothetical protein
MEKREAESKAEQEHKIETLKREQIAIGNGHAVPEEQFAAQWQPLNGNGNGRRSTPKCSTNIWPTARITTRR